MVESARTPRAHPLRHDAVLEAVSFAAESLLLAADWRDVVDEVLARFGIAAGVSRVTVIENEHDLDGRPLVTVGAEWCAPGVPSARDLPSVQGEPWEGSFQRWVDSMSAGQPIVGDVETFPAAEREELLGRQGIAALAYFPVTVEGGWWGCIGFEDCDGPRAWSLSELDGARTAAALLGAAIGRFRQDERLRETESRYRSVVERIPAVTYVDVSYPDEVRMAFLSPQIEQLLGYPAQGFLDDPDSWFDLVHPEDQTRVDGAARRSGNAGAAFDEEYRMRHADGHWVWVHDTSTPVESDRGGVTYFQGFLLDITSRKEAEQAREEAERRYRTMVEALPAVTYVDEPIPGEDLTATMPFVSPQILEILGYPPERFVADQSLWFELMHPDDHARMRADGELSVSNEREVTSEYRMRHADGHWVWVQDTSRPVYADDGTLAYYQGFMMDVSERHAAQERLREAEERFRILVEQMPAIVYTEPVAPGTTEAIGIDYVSEHAARMLGYAPETWVGSTDRWRNVIHPDDWARVQAETGRVNATGEPFSLDYRMIAADGRAVWVHEEAVLIHDAQRAPAYWQGVIFDVTDRVEAMERVRIAEERFRQIVEHTPVITYQEEPLESGLSLDSTMYYISPQIEQILGYPMDRWHERGFWASVTHPDDLHLLEAAFEDQMGPPDTWRCEYRMIAADGRVVWFHDEAILIRDAQGTPLSWQGVMVDITERKEAEDALRRAQARLQALVDHIPAVVYREAIDAAPERFYLSPQVEHIFGYTFEEWARTPDFWVDHIHPDDRALAVEVDARVAQTHEPFSMEYRFRRPDGTYLWVHDEAVFIPGDEVEEGHWQGLLFDVTARKEAEEQLREAERTLRDTVEHLPAIVYREPPAPADRLLYLSPQVRQVLGYDPDEWIQTRDFWVDHIHPDDRDLALATNARADEDRGDFAIEYRFRTKDGTHVWLHDEATFIDDGAGEGHWQGFMLDVTERKLAEEQVREAEEKFRLIVEQSPAVIYQQEFDPDNPGVSRTTYISPQQQRLFGYSPEEVLGDPTLWLRTVHPDDRDRVMHADIGSNRNEHELFSMEYRMISKDGRIVWVEDTAQLVRPHGKSAYWQGFILDITERKIAEEQLERALEVEREATRRLRALDEMKNTFLQAVSHDLRTPLAAILGLAITLERGDVQLPEEDARDLARRIAGNARRLDRLVTNLLDMDRLARGIVTPTLLETDVGSLVRRVLAESDLIPDTRLRTNIQPVTIRADAAKIERIIENLLANTARHTPPDSTIWVSVSPTDDGALIAVEDDGDGIDEELRERIFEPFQQGPEAPRHSPGVGVGLTLVRRFAELHGGKAWVEERAGGGASFRVILPYDPPELSAAALSEMLPDEALP